ncbi:unnamed protein product [Gordionus sp. m RMFG-2023]
MRENESDIYYVGNSTNNSNVISTNLYQNFPISITATPIIKMQTSFNIPSNHPFYFLINKPIKSPLSSTPLIRLHENIPYENFENNYSLSSNYSENNAKTINNNTLFIPDQTIQYNNRNVFCDWFQSENYTLVEDDIENTHIFNTSSNIPYKNSQYFKGFYFSKPLCSRYIWKFNDKFSRKKIFGLIFGLTFVFISLGYFNNI